MTPVMQQWLDAKSQHRDKIILFRMGDFFEFFNEDAEKAAPVLGIQLTQRNKKSADYTPMCGVPHHSLPDIVGKLLTAGHRLAICDQIEDPKFAKGLVKRAVTRVLTPGMVYDPLNLEPTANNYMASFNKSEVAFLDASTGEGFFYSLSKGQSLVGLFKLLSPVEIILPSRQRLQLESSVPSEFLNSVVWLEDSDALISPRDELVNYATRLQGVSFIQTSFEERFWNDRLLLGERVVTHLELLSSFSKQGTSLYEAINTCKTAAGARLLKSWLLFPLIDQGKINQRLDEVEGMTNDFDQLKSIRSTLSQLRDLQRLLGKLGMAQAQPKDLIALVEAIRVGIALEEHFPGFKEDVELRTLADVVDQIDQELESDLAKWSTDYGFIKSGWHVELDRLIELTDHAQASIVNLEARLRQETQINSLKVGYNSVFGYFIEVSKSNLSKVPSHFIRKQTLTNGERFIIEELKALEDQILNASAKRIELEKQILYANKNRLLDQSVRINFFAKKWAHLDVISALAWNAIEKNLVRPQVGATDFNFVQSRHPVVERLAEFRANDIRIKRGELLLLTGPNMAGKSTLMRQVAISVIMAQMGSFVPARKASLPMVDQIFTRIGSSDSLAEGHSTFMVEMIETAALLREATNKSLILLDEIGRGTSTFDGMSLAQSLIEYIVRSIGATTLFATHYHELTRLDEALSEVRNVHMEIKDENGELRFLHRLKDGPAKRSYGIQVAKLAGLPAEIIERAQGILKDLEKEGNKSGSSQMELWHKTPEFIEKNLELDEIVKRLKSVQLDECTPRKALDLLYELKHRLN